MTSTLKPPPKKALAAFHVGQVGNDTIETYLKNRWSLAICCKTCERLVEWTPSMLADMFAERKATRISDLVLRLTCKGEGGCGGSDIAVFPHLYDG